MTAEHGGDNGLERPPPTNEKKLLQWSIGHFIERRPLYPHIRTAATIPASFPSIPAASRVPVSHNRTVSTSATSIPSSETHAQLVNYRLKHCPNRYESRWMLSVTRCRLPTVFDSSASSSQPCYCLVLPWVPLAVAPSSRWASPPPCHPHKSQEKEKGVTSASSSSLSQTEMKTLPFPPLPFPSLLSLSLFTF